MVRSITLSMVLSEKPPRYFACFVNTVCTPKRHGLLCSSPLRILVKSAMLLLLGFIRLDSLPPTISRSLLVLSESYCGQPLVVDNVMKSGATEVLTTLLCSTSHRNSFADFCVEGPSIYRKRLITTFPVIKDFLIIVTRVCVKRYFSADKRIGVNV